MGGTIGTIPLAKGTGDESTKINKRSKRGRPRVSIELNLRRSDMDCNMAREVRLTQLPGDRRDRSILSDLRDRIKVHLSSQAHRCKKTSMALLNVEMQSVKELLHKHPEFKIRPTVYYTHNRSFNSEPLYD